MGNSFNWQSLNNTSACKKKEIFSCIDHFYNHYCYQALCLEKLQISHLFMM